LLEGQFGCETDGITIDREILDLPINLGGGSAPDAADPVETAASLAAFVREMLP